MPPVRPSRQRLRTDDASGVEAHAGLVGDAKLAMRQSVLKVMPQPIAAVPSGRRRGSLESARRGAPVSDVPGPSDVPSAGKEVLMAATKSTAAVNSG